MLPITVLKLAKALMSFGSPSHRIEAQLAATSKVLGINAKFVHIPSVTMVGFGDRDTRTSDTRTSPIPALFRGRTMVDRLSGGRLCSR